jgi:hypothetical protein
MSDTIKIIHAKDLWPDVPMRWKGTYGRYEPGSHHHNITLQLEALSPEDLTGEKIEAIIGNTSWTRISCDICGEEKDTLLHIGDCPGYDQRWVDMCRTCLDKAVAAWDGE